MGQSSAAEYLRDLLQDWAPVSSKAMFGGHGVYRDGLMFGLIANETLYFKVDGHTREVFAGHGCEPFRYRRGGREFAMSYYRCPDEAWDGAADMARWADLGWGAALRGRRTRP